MFIKRTAQTAFVAACLGTFSATALANDMMSRSLFLNGVDISSARNQEMKNVTVRIDENGDLFIEAPHYDVREESEYLPVTKWIEGQGHPKHSDHPKALPVAPSTLTKGPAGLRPTEAVKPSPAAENVEQPAQAGDLPAGP